jgi:hypothetical protein
MPELQRGDVPALGEGKEGSERYPSEDSDGVSVSLLPVWAHISVLPGRDDECGPDGTVASPGGDQLEAGVELSPGEHHPEQPGG